MRQRRQKRRRLPPHQEPAQNAVAQGEEGADATQPESNTAVLCRDEIAHRSRILPSRVLKQFKGEGVAALRQQPPPANAHEESLEERLKKKQKEDELAEKNAPFCCAVCTCSQERKDRVELCEDVEVDRGISLQHYWFETAQGPDHRRCCHGQYKAHEDVNFALPFAVANMKREEYLECMLDEADNGEAIEEYSNLEWVTNSEIHDQYCTTKNQEAQIYNDDSCEGAEGKLLSSKQYVEKILKSFGKQNRLKHGSVGASDNAEGITVLDCFAGVGTAIVALKRLGVKIKTVIHVEKDKVATHVYRWNHDPSYRKKTIDEIKSGDAENDPKGETQHGSSEDDGIKHIFIENFEDLCEGEYFPKGSPRLEYLWALADGPIDLVCGGPPCVDYSAVNAARRGADGTQGEYLVNFGKFIRRLGRAQKKKFKHFLLFIAENVVLRGEDLWKVREAFGFEFDPIEMDALYLSPTRRKRHFFTNIPLDLELSNFDYVGDDSHVGPERCLEPGFVLPDQIVDPGTETIAKANCYMASTTRIDERGSLRMYVFKRHCVTKKEGGNDAKTYYVGRPMTVAEREKIMGYPEGYVGEAVQTLFAELLDCGIAPPDWRKRLDRKYHTFAGNYHKFPKTEPYKFSFVRQGMGEIRMKMAPPLAGQGTPSFYDFEEYSKHLIGNAFSVPVLELLMRPLIQVFPSRVYENYSYRYAWKAQEDDTTTA